MRELISKLDNTISNLDDENLSSIILNVSIEELKEIKDSLIDLNKRTIIWSILDFEIQASENEGFYNRENIYDRNKFQNTLELMISEHDANMGISWDTIDIYLDQYCKYEI